MTRLSLLTVPLVFAACALTTDTTFTVAEDTGVEIVGADAPDASPDAVDEAADSDDAALSEFNVCGGTAPIRAADGCTAAGADCAGGGTCVCDGARDLVCRGDARGQNGCGGTARLPGAPGGPCDACSGTWACEGTDAMICSGAPEDLENECGGCGPLPARPGFACELDGSGEGAWTCDGVSGLACRTGETNDCGGPAEAVLQFDGRLARPGDRCGACDAGRLVCADGETLACEGGDIEGPLRYPELNTCGGCTRLTAEINAGCGCVGAECGSCTATFACSSPPAEGATGALVCTVADDRNACGGCNRLEAEPGELCPGGAWVCGGPETVFCRPAAAGTNACGGTAELDAEPGNVCGPCRDGVTVCSGIDSVDCVGALAPNACGSCADLQVALGETCAPGKVWACDPSELTTPRGDGVSCVAAGGERNACGGSSALDGTPGEPCGTCGRWACTSDAAVTCVTAGDPADYVWYVDADGDSYGAGEPVVLCTPPDAGYSRTNDDCDDDAETGASTNPGAGNC